MESAGEAMFASPDFAGEFILAKNRDRVPLTYTLQAANPASERKLQTSDSTNQLIPDWPEGIAVISGLPPGYLRW